MKITLAVIDHEQEDGVPTPDFEDFIRTQMPAGTRVVVEWNGMFCYADVVG